MKKIIIFAGTTEGRTLSEGLAVSGIAHTVFVATEYGALVMEPDPLVTVKSGRLDEPEMETVFRTSADIIYDATHPFATVVTENIRTACANTGTEYVRVRRADLKQDLCGSRIRYFDSTSSCAEALKETEGNILLSTGSKEIRLYAGDDSVRERLFARVLPSEESIRLCTEAGLAGKQIIAMHGPFSAELNEAMIRQYGIRCFVTKQSGLSGGYYEKVKAAEASGTELFVIGRPEEEEGISVEAVLNQYGVRLPVTITLIGYGPGGRELLTLQARTAIENADVVFGSSRLVQAVSGKQVYPYYLAKDVIPVLEEGTFKKAVVLFSGDSGFFSGTEKMRRELLSWAKEKDIPCEIKVYPGISSLVYLAAQTHEAYQESPFLSLHGRSGDGRVFAGVIAKIRENEKVFLILSGAEDVRRLGAALRKSGLSGCKVLLGYELSYPEEKISELTPEECEQIERKGLYAAVIKNPFPQKKRLTPFPADEEFIRTMEPAEDKKDAGQKQKRPGGKDAPMTKELIRHASIIRLDLKAGDVLYDIGSGTGSVSVEAALLDPSVTVYAVEKKEAALRLTQSNAEKFGCSNIRIVPGEAPEALVGLEAPTHVFIGGSGGNLKDILESVKEKNEHAKVVINAISLETIAEVSGLLKETVVSELKIEQIACSIGKTLGRYHLLSAENPVFLFSFRLGREPDAE